MATDDIQLAFRTLLIESRLRVDEASRLLVAAERCAENQAQDYGIELFDEVTRCLDNAKVLLVAAGTVDRLAMD